MNTLKPVMNLRPLITAWNRLEGRPRKEDFDRSLRAEVRDALWMLSRQWQMSEFEGDDAASPILAKVHMERTALTKYRAAGGTAEAMPHELPLEVKVEHQAIPFELLGKLASGDLRQLMGRHWLKLVRKSSLAMATKQAAQTDFRARYNFEQPDPTDSNDALLTAHPESWQRLAAVGNRAMDGFRLYQYLKDNPANRASDGIASLSTIADQDLVNQLGLRFTQWFEKLYYQPDPVNGNPSWKPSYLEHQFAVSAPEKGTEKVLMADEYFQGHLDWYNLDVADTQTPLGSVPDAPAPSDVEGATTLSFIPTGIQFPGMPHTRWWQFEEQTTNFGDIRADTTDLNKLMLLEFGLQYANDWFLLPFTLPAGAVATVKGMAITDVFGDRTWVTPSGSGLDEQWQSWRMYNLSVRGTANVAADLSLVLPPSAPKVLEGKPLEEFFLLRDEIANMVWAVERRIPLPSGQSKNAREAARELYAKLGQFISPVPAPPLLPNEAAIQYQLVNTVPEQWIPFIPVHLPGNIRQIQLQRAAMPRIYEGDPNPPKKIEARTALLREGLDSNPAQPYFLHEEEVPRAGTRVRKSFQRTRWYNGRVYNWIGIRKQTGRGEGASGLAFDQIPLKDKA